MSYFEREHQSESRKSIFLIQILTLHNCRMWSCPSVTAELPALIRHTELTCPLFCSQFTKRIQNESERKGEKREKEKLKHSFIPPPSLKYLTNPSIIKMWMQSTQQWCRIPPDPRPSTTIAVYPCSSHSTSRIDCHVYNRKKNHLLKTVTKR